MWQTVHNNKPKSHVVPSAVTPQRAADESCTLCPSGGRLGIWDSTAPVLKLGLWLEVSMATTYQYATNWLGEKKN